MTWNSLILPSRSRSHRRMLRGAQPFVARGNSDTMAGNPWLVRIETRTSQVLGVCPTHLIESVASISLTLDPAERLRARTERVASLDSSTFK